MELDRENVDAHICLGNVYEQINDFQRAIMEYRKVLKIDKKNTRAFEAIAKLESAGHFALKPVGAPK